MGIDPDFRRDILDINIKGSLQFCYQCNRCTSECPVSNNTDKFYNPRQLMLDSLLGLKDKILEPEDTFHVFGCTVCDRCDEVCPGSLALTEVFYLLKNKLAQMGKAPASYIGQAKVIAENGKAIPMQSAIERRRTQMGLAAVPDFDLEEVKTVLKEAGFGERVKVDGGE
ncbi:MAG TPA: 4Fe-4S dicluster domain-containing protein [Candidatus Lokiarchaeia archaeon]|nr:4Fe-4S dicluster domain-containing protein [Candidatus Lokiarchaeia archaeon]